MYSVAESSLFFSYEQEKRSLELIDYAHFFLEEYGMSKDRRKFGSLSSTSRSSSSSDLSAFGFDDLDGFSSDCEGSKEQGDIAKKDSWEKTRAKFEERDRLNQVDYLLKRKILQLSRQQSLPIIELSTVPVMSNSNNNMETNIRKASQANIEPLRRNSSAQISGDLPIKSILNLSNHLRSTCDKILDNSTPFCIDSLLLCTISEAITQLTTNQLNPSTKEAFPQLESSLLFISDFFEQSPSLVIIHSENTSLNSAVDLTLFRSLKYLELRRLPIQLVSGLNTVRAKLQVFKCSRNMESLDEIFGSVSFCAEIVSTPGNVLTPLSSPLLTSVWPELIEIDASFNKISSVDGKSLEFTPTLTSLNLSRNRLTSFDINFSRVLHCLTILNLNFNQLTSIPSLPPNLKVLLLSNNYISSLAALHFPSTLEKMDLSQNIIGSFNHFEALRHCPNLKFLSFVGNPISYMENYRKRIASNLSRTTLKSANFVLDSKRLTSSEVKVGLENTKRLNSPMNPPTFFLFKKTNASSKKCDTKVDMTASMDSTSSSSLKGACRKKPKFREIIIFDENNSSEPKIEKISEDKYLGVKRHEKVLRSSSVTTSYTTISSNSSIEEVPENHPEVLVKETGDALENLRKKYGENWLSRQGGMDVASILKIEHRSPRPKQPLLLSRSVPLSHSNTSGGFSNWELSNSSTVVPLEESSSPKKCVSVSSEESIKLLDEENSTESSDGLLFYTCNESPSSSLFSDEMLAPPQQVFTDPTQTAAYYKIFEAGKSFQLAIQGHFLYHIDPAQNNTILANWDLRSLKTLKEEHRNGDAETVTFTTFFDTMRKSFRERTFIMTLSDFKLFKSKTSKYLELQALAEFGEAFQCAKCNWLFSKRMAGIEVRGNPPVEVPVCLNPNCKSEFLIPVDSNPTSDWTINSTDSTVESPTSGKTPPKSIPQPRTSTPLFGGLFSGKNNNPSETVIGSGGRGVKEAIQDSWQGLVSTIVPRASPPTSTNTTIPNTTKNGQNDSGKEKESDVESCDSSSIEVLAKTGNNSGNDDSGSDVAVVEEGLEVEPLFNTTVQANVAVGPMTDSTSSGSISTGSICTQYEKTPTNSQIGLKSPFLTPFQPNVLQCQPFKYDYQEFTQVDHRLMLFSDLNLFKQEDEKLLALTKVLIINSNESFNSIIIISNKKIYVCRITNFESDRIDNWLQPWKSFSLSKLAKFDVLIGKHGVGLDFNGKYFAVVFRDSDRTTNFIGFFLGEVCAELEEPPFVQDYSQTYKDLKGPNASISYFGILRQAKCTSTTFDKTYALPAVVVSDEELILVVDLLWLVNHSKEVVTVKHNRELSKLRQVETFEGENSLVRLMFQIDPSIMLKWDLIFETNVEKCKFLESLKAQVKEIPFVELSQPKQA